MNKYILSIVLFFFFIPQSSAEDNLEKEIKIEYKYTIYQNQSESRIKNFFNSLISTYMKLDTFFFEHENADIKGDINFIKVKKKFNREIAFIKGLQEKDAGLTKTEERMFFPQIVYNKDKTLIARGEGSVYEEEVELTEKISGTYRIKIDTKSGKIEIFKKNKNGDFIKNYSGKTDIPKNTSIYKTAVVFNEKNEHTYLVVWFFSDSGIGTNILSISGGANIELVSNVTGLLINNNSKYNFETINCYQDYSYIIVKGKSLKLLCLDKKNDTMIRERSLIN